MPTQTVCDTTKEMEGGKYYEQLDYCEVCMQSVFSSGSFSFTLAGAVAICVSLMLYSINDRVKLL